MNLNHDHKLKVKKDDLVSQIHSYGLDLQSNHIYVMGMEQYSTGMGLEDMAEPGVEYTMANQFIRNMNLCQRVNKGTPILIQMKTCGGDWGEGMSMYDSIKSCPDPVTILSYNHARSMSSLILQAANKRVLQPHSYFLFHEGTSGMEGTHKQFQSAAKFDRRSITEMLDVYVSSVKKSNGTLAKKTPTQIKNWMRALMKSHEDVYLSAKDAVKYGFADEIFDGDWPKLIDYTELQLNR